MSLIVTKGDMATANFRSKMELLSHYLLRRRVPVHLKDAALSHLQLSQNLVKEKTDALDHCPPLVRKQILTHVYGSAMARMYIFNGCRKQFMDKVRTSPLPLPFVSGFRARTL
eukprot:144972-Prorocentrum_minimum.AAC.2